MATYWALSRVGYSVLREELSCNRAVKTVPQRALHVQRPGTIATFRKGQLTRPDVVRHRNGSKRVRGPHWAVLPLPPQMMAIGRWPGARGPTRPQGPDFGQLVMGPYVLTDLLSVPLPGDGLYHPRNLPDYHGK